MTARQKHVNTLKYLKYPQIVLINIACEGCRLVYTIYYYFSFIDIIYSYRILTYTLLITPGVFTMTTVIFVI